MAERDSGKWKACPASSGAQPLQHMATSVHHGLALSELGPLWETHEHGCPALTPPPLPGETACAAPWGLQKARVDLLLASLPPFLSHQLLTSPRACGQVESCLLATGVRQQVINTVVILSKTLRQELWWASPFSP